MKKKLAVAAILVLLCLLAGQLADVFWGKERGLAPTRLKAVILEDPRFPPVDSGRVESILDATRTACREHLGLKVVFEGTPDRMTAEDYFESRYSRLKHPDAFDALSVDLRGGNTERLRRAYRREIANLFPGDEGTLTLRAQLEPGPDNEALDREGVIDRLIDGFIARHMQALALKNEAGDYVIDPKNPRVNRYFAWELAAKAETEYDLAFTNELLASADLVDIDLHYLTRGGVNGGFTMKSRARHGATSYISLFPFDSADPLFVSARKTPATEDGTTGAVAALTAHELGHLIPRYGHPWEQRGCLMRPATNLDFWSWSRGLRPGACRGLKRQGFFEGSAGDALAGEMEKLGLQAEAAAIRQMARENEEWLDGKGRAEKDGRR